MKFCPYCGRKPTFHGDRDMTGIKEAPDSKAEQGGDRETEPT
jgi:hypothetical protein